MLHGKGCKKDVKIIVWSGLLFLCLAARALATGVVGYLPMSDGEYAQKRALKPLLTLPYSVSPDQTWHFRQVGVSGVTLLPEPKKDNEWRISGKDSAGNSWVVPVGRLINLAGNAQFYRADLDRNGIQDLVIWLSGWAILGWAWRRARNTSFSPFSRMAAPASLNRGGFIPPAILASMICLIYRAMGVRNCWICSLTQATG